MSQPLERRQTDDSHTAQGIDGASHSKPGIAEVDGGIHGGGSMRAGPQQPSRIGYGGRAVAVLDYADDLRNVGNGAQAGEDGEGEPCCFWYKHALNSFIPNGDQARCVRRAARQSACSNGSSLAKSLKDVPVKISASYAPAFELGVR